MVNYVAETKHNINLRYMFRRADLQSAVKDHDYLTRPFTEFWVLDNIKVIIITIIIILTLLWITCSNHIMTNIC